MNRTAKLESEITVMAIGGDLKYICWFYTQVHLYLANYIFFTASF